MIFKFQFYFVNLTIFSFHIWSYLPTYANIFSTSDSSSDVLMLSKVRNLLISRPLSTPEQSDWLRHITWGVERGPEKSEKSPNQPLLSLGLSPLVMWPQMCLKVLDFLFLSRSVCRPGTFNDTGVCMECPTGTFRELYLDALQCTDCLTVSDNRTTIGTGAQSNTECGKDISSLYSIKLI